MFDPAEGGKSNVVTGRPLRILVHQPSFCTHTGQISPESSRCGHSRAVNHAYTTTTGMFGLLSIHPFLYRTIQIPLALSYLYI